ncbi:hypothetical protein L3X38_030183 [Prunus dulcis]|uniref:Uncharacterized protein n=1 Tax=Prunus dulcis TaxID=3755 RepID=A0AAD4YST9_PRUDU|nr:hypothetical protein L3X38_030183 [Prunus dulcis]
MKQNGLVKVPGCSWVERGDGQNGQEERKDPEESWIRMTGQESVGVPTRKSSFVGAYENFPECQEQIGTSQLNFFLDAAVNFS